MKVVSLKDAKVEKRSGGIFLGDVEVTTLIDESIGSKEYRVAIVTFSPNARNKWHVHDHDQLLYVLKGKGIVATEKEERLVTVGDTILIPAGEKHWHGATEDSIFSHLYVMKVGTKTSF